MSYLLHEFLNFWNMTVLQPIQWTIVYFDPLGKNARHGEQYWFVEFPEGIPSKVDSIIQIDPAKDIPTMMKAHLREFLEKVFTQCNAKKEIRMNLWNKEIRIHDTQWPNFGIQCDNQEERTSTIYFHNKDGHVEFDTIDLNPEATFAPIDERNPIRPTVSYRFDQQWAFVRQIISDTSGKREKTLPIGSTDVMQKIAELEWLITVVSEKYSEQTKTQS